MKAIKIILLALAFIALQAHADDERNLAVKQVNNVVSEQRIALVIGNGAYTNSPLKNPVNDAKDMAKKLRGLGFDVIERSNLQTKQIGATLREFRSKLVPGAVALVFYAGHGLQIKGDNYLPAVDADINSEEDVPNQSLAVKQIMDVLDESKTRLNLVFLDACRNNPYARSFRSADKGLARVSAPSGTLISYATRPGSIAADGNGRNGLYTSKLLAQMDSNVQIEQALKQVVTAVKAASQGKQEPWMEGSIEGDFCFAGCAASGGTQVVSLVPVPAQARTAEQIEDDLWDAIKTGRDSAVFEEYLRQYPQGRYLAEARVHLASIKSAASSEMPESRIGNASQIRTIKLEISDDMDRRPIYASPICNYFRPLSSLLSGSINTQLRHQLPSVTVVDDGDADAEVVVSPIKADLIVVEGTTFTHTMESKVQLKFRLNGKVIHAKMYRGRSVHEYPWGFSCSAWDKDISSELEKVLAEIAASLAQDIAKVIEPPSR